MRTTKGNITWFPANFAIGILLCVILLSDVGATENSGNSRVSSSFPQEGEASVSYHKDNDVTVGGKNDEKIQRSEEKEFGKALEESLRETRERRRTPFRADLGKRNDFEWTVDDVKRAPKIKSFRSDLGKRRLGGQYTVPATNFDVMAKGEEEETGFVDMVGDRSRRKRFAGTLMESDEHQDAWKALENEGNPTSALEKRFRSSFRSDLGKRSSAQLSPAREIPKRARYGFRGDLGKRSESFRFGDAEADKRRYSFRGDLGRKRSATWNDQELDDSFDDDKNGFQKFFSSSSKDQFDADDYESLEKRLFRADLG